MLLMSCTQQEMPRRLLRNTTVMHANDLELMWKAAVQEIWCDSPLSFFMSWSDTMGLASYTAATASRLACMSHQQS